MPAPRKYDEETRTRAVRVYRDRVADSGESMIEARRQVAALLDINPSTLRSWIERHNIDHGDRPGATLRRWRTTQLEERMQWGEGWQDTGLVFTREDGTGVHPDRVSKAFKARVAEANLPEIRLHDLRHTWASLAQSAGVAWDASFGVVGTGVALGLGFGALGAG